MQKQGLNQNFNGSAKQESESEVWAKNGVVITPTLQDVSVMPLVQLQIDTESKDSDTPSVIEDFCIKSILFF